MKLTSSVLNSFILEIEDSSLVPSRPTMADDILDEIDLLETEAAAADVSPGCVVLVKVLEDLAAVALNLLLECKPRLITVIIVLKDII